MSVPEGELISVWYRSLLPDGTVWCETSDRDECVEQSRGRDCTFQRLEIRRVEGPWEVWTPDA